MANNETSISDISHHDKRINNPTEELRNFVVDDDKTPQKVAYPRDPSLDPQLVWKGKDQQDSEDLEVDVLPIYIQETIKPRAIIEEIRATGRSANNQTDLFSDSHGLEFAELVDFYQHAQTWRNRMILGDSLLVMNSLAEKERLKGKVQMIYIDPPYGIQFGSNWQVSTRTRKVEDGKVEDLTRQPEQVKAYRDTWALGIHSYLSYLRDRLVVARELLTESGSAFVQIGEENLHLARCIMDEVFGSKQFVRLITFAKTGARVSNELGRTCDYLIWYAKDKSLMKFRPLFNPKGPDSFFCNVELTDGSIRKITKAEHSDPSLVPDGARIFQYISLTADGAAREDTPFEFQGKVYRPQDNTHWKLTYPDGMQALKTSGRIVKTGNRLKWKSYIDNYPLKVMSHLWNDTSGFYSNKKYVIETRTKVIERCLLMTTDPGDLVLDPTCGSGTTAYVAEQWGRRWITIDTSRVSQALARTRLMSARYLYYILADSHEGVMIEAKLTNDADRAINAKTSHDIKKGFVYRREPHIMLKSISNNPEINGIHAKWQEQLEPLCAVINKLAGENWEEWEIPPIEQAKAKIPNDSATLSAVEKWWEVRHSRQADIESAIARHSEHAILYDKPYECDAKKKIRVTGPFTVESLSPHRVLPTDIATHDYHSLPEYHQFSEMIIENLKSAGVQNGVKSERLKFDSLASHAGEQIAAVGEYIENEETKRAAICIVPHLVTVGAKHIREAAKEAMQGLGFDLLIVCGFAFDSAVVDERKQYGTLTVLTARMNTDLTMGDEVLKKTGTGNLFIVFGEPDVHIETQPDGKIVAEVRGVDGYNPVKGTRSFSTDDIACWFIDTNYNGESFFVRHAYFTGADQPYENLKKALRTEINEEAWESLYTTKSRPFDKPTTGKIAVKVINHYGDEVLKVYHT